MEIVRKNVRLQYRDSVLGMFWTFLQPLLTTLILVLVFGRVFGRTSDGIVNYPIYLLCGRLMYEFFTQSTKRAMRSIAGSASVIKKVYVPKYIYPLANTTSTFVTFLISLSVLVVMMAYFMLFTETELHLTPYILLAIVPIGQKWNWQWFYYARGFSVVSLLIGTLLFYKKQDKFILHL
jgi:ABC-type polysaccharide/polyol phosphate export permease